MTSFAGFREWIEAFRRDPAARLDRLLRMAESVTPMQRGDPSDAAAMALRSEGTEDDRRAADQALALWLAARLADPPEEVARVGRGPYLAYATEALRLAVRLPLEHTGRLLRDRHEEFDGWALALSSGHPGDLRFQYLTALAHNQGDSLRFRELWLSLCDQSGRALLPEAGLDIGLLGLRLLPRPADIPPPGEAALEGLACWARHLPDNAAAEAHFLLRWRSLAGRHPRHPDVWRRPASELLDTYALRPFARWWAADLALPPGAPPREPLRKDADALVKRIATAPLAELESLVAPFVRWHQRHAAATRSLGHLPAALNQVGNAVLRRGAASLAARIAVTILDHAPSNEHSWVLWSAALDRQGLTDAAESVLWDATRRLPDHVACRVALADLLVRLGRGEEAEALYRQTMERFPDNDVCRNALAKLLADRGETVAAETLYRQTMERFPDNAVCRLDLGLMLVRLARLTEVAPVLEQLERMKHTGANTLRAHLEAARAGRPMKPRRDDPPPPVAGSGVSGEGWEGMLASGRALRAKFLLSPALDAAGLRLMTAEKKADLKALAEDLLAEAMRMAPGHPVVRLIARRHAGKAAGPVDEAMLVAGGDYGLRLDSAIAAQRDDAFIWLYEDFPDAARRAVTAVGWLLHDTYAENVPQAAEAAQHLSRWLARDAEPAETPVLLFFHAQMRAMLNRRFWGTDLDTFIEAWRDLNPQELRHLLDVVLLALAMTGIAAVAYDDALAA